MSHLFYHFLPVEHLFAPRNINLLIFFCFKYMSFLAPAFSVCDKEDQVQSMQSIPVNEFNQPALIQMKNLIENYSVTWYKGFSGPLDTLSQTVFTWFSFLLVYSYILSIDFINFIKLTLCATTTLENRCYATLDQIVDQFWGGILIGEFVGNIFQDNQCYIFLIIMSKHNAVIVPVNLGFSERWKDISYLFLLLLPFCLCVATH